LYAVNVGDLTNNWVGGLQRLYAHQTTTDDEATELLEWLVSQVPWLLMVLGNHDRWGPLAAHICQSHGVTYASHGAMVSVESYGQPIVMDVRHTHRGNSMYNPSHGQLKKSFRGSDADIIIGGHTHSSAYTMVKNGVTGRISHCVRIGAFKRYDDYADSQGFEDENISPVVLAVCCPDSEHKVLMDHDIDRGLKILKALRAA
jgi:hypothetical protein